MISGVDCFLRPARRIPRELRTDNSAIPCVEPIITHQGLARAILAQSDGSCLVALNQLTCIRFGGWIRRCVRRMCTPIITSHRQGANTTVSNTTVSNTQNVHHHLCGSSAFPPRLPPPLFLPLQLCFIQLTGRRKTAAAPSANSMPAYNCRIRHVRVTRMYLADNITTSLNRFTSISTKSLVFPMLFRSDLFMWFIFQSTRVTWYYLRHHHHDDKHDQRLQRGIVV